MRPPRFRTKDFSTCMGSTTARGLDSCWPKRMNQYCLLFKRTRSAPRSSTHFAAQYPAYGLLCERFALALAGHHASLEWFLACLDRAFDGAEIILAAVLAKAGFWEKHGSTPLNDRQRNVLNCMLDGFEGKLTTSKWAKLTKCSQDTALRDIADLVEHGILVKDAGGGRSTSYSLKDFG